MTTRKEVNELLSRTNIKGREYIDVSQRIQGFWELFPNGRIVTEELEDNGQRCKYKASIYNEGDLLATGHAFEERKGMINSTSYVENCETSAVGRALGILGIGSTESIASADEVNGAVALQNAGKDPLAAAKGRLWAAVKSYAAEHGADPKAVIQGVEKRPDAKMGDPAWLASVAAEFEGA